MFKKFFCAVTVLVIGLSVALAEEFNASISKVADGKVTFTKMLKKGEKGETATLPTTADCKVVNGKFNQDTKKIEAGDPLADGLKSTTLSTIGEKGVRARITTDADGKKITQILIMKGRKKKAGN